MKFYFCLLFSLLINFSLLAQEGAYRIDSVDYHISGRTKPRAIEHYFGKLENKSFQSIEELVAFLAHYEETMAISHSFQFAKVSYEASSATAYKVTISVIDSLIMMPLLIPIYSSSIGFNSLIILIMNNTGGNLYNTNFIGGLLFKAREDRIDWAHPSWSGGIAFNNLKAGAFLLNTGFSYNTSIVSSADRGNEIFTYEATTLNAGFGVQYPLTEQWMLQAESAFSRSLTHKIRKNIDNYGNLIGEPYTFKVSQSLGALYDGAPLLKFRRAGQRARITTTYNTFHSLNDEKTHHEFETEAKFGQYWTISSFYNIALIFTAFGKNGLPDFTLGRFVQGMRNNELRGRFGLFATSEHLFKVLATHSKKNEEIDTFQLHMGPIVSYAAVFEPERTFDAKVDQGAAVGIKSTLFLGVLPSMPIETTIAYDLRQKAKSRLDISISTSFMF